MWISLSLRSPTLESGLQERRLSYMQRMKWGLIRHVLIIYRWIVSGIFCSEDDFTKTLSHHQYFFRSIRPAIYSQLLESANLVRSNQESRKHRLISPAPSVSRKVFPCRMETWRVNSSKKVVHFHLSRKYVHRMIWAMEGRHNEDKCSYLILLESANLVCSSRE